MPKNKNHAIASQTNINIPMKAEITRDTITFLYSMKKYIKIDKNIIGVPK
jgi:hypothetical protein